MHMQLPIYIHVYKIFFIYFSTLRIIVNIITESDMIQLRMFLLRQIPKYAQHS